MCKKFFLVFFLLFPFVDSWAQVGINTLNPNPVSELDIQNKIEGLDTVPKGIIIPRLRTNQRNAINTSNLGSSNGLLIYNLDEDCFNYFNKQSAEWKSLCGKLGASVVSPIDCKSINVDGQYQNHKALTTANFMTINVNVSKPGTYTISALSLPDNGYYFTNSAEFLSTGQFELTLIGAGTPQIAGDNQFDVYVNGKKSGCAINVKVEDTNLKPLFEMDCTSAKTFGIYKVNTPLTASNYIELTINVDAAAIGAAYKLQTNTVDGISFKSEGTLNSLSQTVRLLGSGIPTSVDQKTLTISSNSQKLVTTCRARVTVTVPKKTILALAAPSMYGYNAAQTGTFFNNLLISSNNFGTSTTSTVAHEGFNFVDGGRPSASQLNDLLKAKPDIVIVGFDYQPDKASTDALIDYLLKRGVLILFCEAAAPVQNIMQAVFNSPSVTAGNIGVANAGVFQFSLTNDPILNGPFGDIRAKHWGQDNNITLGVFNMPASEVEVYTTGYNASQNSGPSAVVTSFRHKTLNLIFAGDGGFTSGEAADYKNICPFRLDGSQKPIPKPAYGGSSNKFSVYNSTFTANAIAWAIQQAEFDGINSHK